jgi:hypothetical protein
MLIDNSAPDDDWEGVAFVSAISLVNVYQNTTNIINTTTTTTNSHELVLRLRNTPLLISPCYLPACLAAIHSLEPDCD